jgi:CRP-like cAMP-binding protein
VQGWKTTNNHLLAALPQEELQEIEPWFDEVPLPRDTVIARPGERIDDAFFPLSGMISVVALMSGGLGAEVATIGNEGMVGLPGIQGAGSSPFHVMAQLSGEAVRVPAAQLEKALPRLPHLANLVGTYSQAFFVQTAQNAACNGLHSVSERGARWLLTTHDRADGDEFFLTQEYLAFMLGVTRQSVGHAVAGLADHGPISYSRGAMQIKDRAGLEAASCECYEIVRAEFSRLLGIARA